MEAKALESKAAATPPLGDAKAGAPSPAASPTALASGAAGFDEADLAAQTQLEHDVEVDFDAEDKRLAYKLGEHAWALDGAAPDVITALKCDSTALYWATAGGVLVAYDPKRRQQTLRLELARHAAAGDEDGGASDDEDASDGKGAEAAGAATAGAVGAANGEEEEAPASNGGGGASKPITVSSFDVSVGTVAVGSEDGSVSLWSLQSGNNIKLWQDGAERVSAVRFVDNTLHTTSFDGRFQVRDLEYDRIIHSFAHCACPLSALCVQDANVVLLGSWDGTVRAVDLRAQAVAYELALPGYSPVRCVLQSESGVFAGHGAAGIRAWDARTRGVMVEDFAGHSDVVNSLALSGGFLYSGSDDRTVRVFDVARGVCVDALAGQPDGVTCVQLFGDSLYAASYQATVRSYSVTAVEGAVETRRRRMEEGRRIAQELWLKQRDEAKNRKKKGAKKKGGSAKKAAK